MYISFTSTRNETTLNNNSQVYKRLGEEKERYRYAYLK